MKECNLSEVWLEGAELRLWLPLLIPWKEKVADIEHEWLVHKRETTTGAPRNYAICKAETVLVAQDIN